MTEPVENKMFPSAEPTPPTPETPTPPAEFTPDSTKSQEENDAAKLAFDTAAAEKKTADDKAEADKKAAEAAAPLTKEAIKLPEGFEADDASMTKFLEILNDKVMAPTDRANALVNLQAEVAKSWSEKATAHWDDFNKAQQEEVKADPELGGAKLPATLAVISDLLNTYGDAEVRKVLDDSGAGNSRAMVRFLHKIAGLVGEGKPAVGAATSQPKTQAEKMFPNMKG